MKPEIKNIPLDHTKRAIIFPYPVKMVGYTFGAPPVRHVQYNFPEYIEFAIRLRSRSEAPTSTVKQKICETEYCNHFPHALIKLPDQPYEYLDFPLRDVFFWYYDVSLYEEFQELGVFKGNMVWDIELTPEIDFLLGRIMGYMNQSQKAGIADRIDLACFELLNELLILRECYRTEEDTSRELAAKIDSYLRFHVMDIVSIDELPEKFNLSKSSFFRYWKRFFKETPAKYLMDLKLKEAARLLCRDSKKVVEISQLLNFNEPAYFCAVFRKKYGMTPRQYREQARNNKVQI
jgi:AraC-like DNA-binding protein